MTQTIKSTETTYDVTAQVLVEASDGFHILNFDCGGFDTKNKVILKKLITEQVMKDLEGNFGEGSKVKGITNIGITKYSNTVAYKFDMSSYDVIAACIAYCENEGLEYKQLI